MKLIAIAMIGGLFATGASAQSTSTTPTPAPMTAPATGTVTTTTPGMAPATGNAMKGTVLAPTAAMPGTAAAPGDTNAAVATTDANAPQAAKGANSFTSGEAQRRIEGQGYTMVADLQKDSDGVWRGHGMKGGASVGVWLDYKGNIGQQ